MGKLKSIIDLNLIAIFCLAAFGYLAYNSLNNKMEKVSSIWKTANNVVTKNQSKVIKIREAFSDEQDQLTVFIDNMPDNERKQWLA
jgi:predicted RNA-binding protein Jag